MEREKTKIDKPCRPGSTPQHEDMCETGDLKGDQVLFSHGIPEHQEFRPVLDERLMEQNFHVDLSEDGREGDEESGDEHSSGLQGDEIQELLLEPHYPGASDAGVPGEETYKKFVSIRRARRY